MLVAKSRDIPYSEVTPKSSYLNRVPVQREMERGVFR